MNIVYIITKLKCVHANIYYFIGEKKVLNKY